MVHALQQAWMNTCTYSGQCRPPPPACGHRHMLHRMPRHAMHAYMLLGQAVPGHLLTVLMGIRPNCGTGLLPITMGP